MLHRGGPQFLGPFQFLLVRLKETYKYVFRLLSYISIPTGTIKSGKLAQCVERLRSISIPTGTIKSLLMVMVKELGIKFQFLLVRLKVERQIKRLFEELFQFLLVRLKGH